MTPSPQREPSLPSVAHRGLADARVVVCVPTYRRPASLASLLRSLALQRGVEPFAILIGNNDDGPLEAHPALRAADLPPFDSIQVAMRGVTAVRNAMLAAVLARAPHARWIACLDDDQVPSGDWLAALLRVGEEHAADLVGGPVARLPATSTFWSTLATDTSYLPREAGPTAGLNEAGNLLLSTGFLRTLGRPAFSPEFGRSGGEDYEFFLFARSRHARLAWAPDAYVEEGVDAGRLSFGGFVWRFYSIAAYQARADRRYRGFWSVLCGAGLALVKAPLHVLRALLVNRNVARAIGVVVRQVAIFAGRLAGLAGIAADRYGDAVHGAAPRR